MDKDTFVSSIIDIVEHADVSVADDFLRRELEDGKFSDEIITAVLQVARNGVSKDMQARACAECLFDIINKRGDEGGQYT